MDVTLRTSMEMLSVVVVVPRLKLVLNRTSDMLMTETVCSG
jgi:hypothetical protein